MTTRRSYLDSLNTGRQRRSSSSLDDLNRTLERLENQLERPSPFADLRRRERERDYEEQAPVATLQSVVRELDRHRREGDGLAAVSQIAEELRSLREDMRREMTREFDSLRSDVRRISEEDHHDNRADSAGLRGELEEVKAAVNALAREDTLREVGDRWDQMDQRMSGFEQRINERSSGGFDADALRALVDRIEQIAGALNEMPDTEAMQTLEEKVRTLAGALDQFARHQEAQSSETYDMIGERLDEISRAIAASAGHTTIDPEPLQRIEARVASLASQIEELSDDSSAREMVGQLNALTVRVDEIATRAEVPHQAVERLGRQLTSIVDHLEAQPPAPDAEALFKGLEKRFSSLSEMLDRRQGDAVEQGNVLLREMEKRLDGIVERIDTHAEDRIDTDALLGVMDERFADLAVRLDDRVANGPEAASIRAMESRLEDIAERLEKSAKHVKTLDQGVIAKLESQVAELSAHLAKPAPAMPDLDDLAPRFDQLERSIADTQENLIEAARLAAAEAIRDMGSTPVDLEGVTALSGDLRALEILTRKSDERNARTFDAIHDTLIKIVDRLSSMEHGDPRSAQPAALPTVSESAAPEVRASSPAKPILADAPSIEPRIEGPIDDLPMDDLVLRDETVDAGEPIQRSPAEAAAAAAAAALGGKEEDEPKSMRSGLGRMLRRRGAAVEAKAEVPVVRSEPVGQEVGLDTPLTPTAVDQPLEPGQGPDLNAIMKRVRDERGTARSPELDAAKSDFIAAARRAAQAAAAETDVKKRGSDHAGAGSGNPFARWLGGRKRKAALMATVATAVGLGGWQLASAFMGAEDNDVVRMAEVSSVATPVVALPEAPVAEPAKSVASLVEADTVVKPLPVVTRKIEPVQPEPAAELAAATVPVAPAKPLALVEADPAAVASLSRLPEQQIASLAPPAESARPKAIPMEAGPTALRQAAEANDPKALFEIGARYAEGQNGAADQKTAADWYQRSAELGFAPAQYRIGNFYEKGLGVDRDIGKAKDWYRKAAYKGNASAMHNLAVLYAMGADGKTDNVEAVRWFKQAAELGVTDSQFNLGILAAKGVGMSQDIEASYLWFAIVAETGDKDAAGKRDELAAALNTEQLARAKARVGDWKARPLNAEANSVDVAADWKTSDEATASVDMRKAVTNIQLILNKNGYDAGTPDGSMGQKTRDAIVAFQKANGLVADGQVNEALVRALLAKK